MSIHSFHAWPDDQFCSVAKRFLSGIDFDGNDPEVIVQFIANADSRVIKMSAEYLESEGR